MSQYLIVHDYTSGNLGPFKKGDVVEIDDRIIEWFLRDSPGVAELVEEPAKCKAKPKHNRMVVKAENRSAEPEQVMTTENMVGLTKG